MLSLCHWKWLIDGILFQKRELITKKSQYENHRKQSKRSTVR